MTALVRHATARAWVFFAGVVAVLLASAGARGAGRWCGVKMLPFDNKSELQVLVDHDEGTPARGHPRDGAPAEPPPGHPARGDATCRSTRARPRPSTSTASSATTSCAASRLQADLQVNLARQARAREPEPRHRQGDPARAAGDRPRPPRRRVKVVEIPPGPPVLDTLVAEIYGPTAAAAKPSRAPCGACSRPTPGVVDVSDSLEAERTRAPAARSTREGRPARVPAWRWSRRPWPGSGAGRDVARLDEPAAREPVPVRVRLSAADRAEPRAAPLAARGPRPASGRRPRRAGLRATPRPEPQPIVHKDLKPVIYVIGDLAGARESPVYALAALNRRDRRACAVRRHRGWSATRSSAPLTSDRPAVKWDGEWQITYEVFRDLGIAFAVVLVLIAILVIGWFQSLHRAACHPAAHPALAHRHPARALAVRRVLHGDLHDRLHRRGRDHRAQLDHPRRLHRAEAAPGHGPRGGGGGGRRGALPPHAAHGRRGGGRVVRDPVRSDLPGARHQPDDGRGRGDLPLPDGRARRLLPDRPSRPRRGPSPRSGSTPGG